MKAIHIFVVILSLGLASASKTYFMRGVNGGLECAACTIVVGLLEQIAEIKSKNISDVVSNICDALPTTYEKFCRIIVRLWGPIIIDKMVRKESSDVICYSVGLCHVDKDEEFCHLFPIPKEGMYPAIMKSQQASRTLQNILQLNFKSANSFCDHEVLQFLCDMIDRFLNQAKPLIDLDGDSYSTVQDWRGSSWRGKDCNDLTKHIQPGRRPADYDRDIDSNCNGIWGTNKITGEPYEKELCEGTNPRGLVYIGDSVGAHFHVPSQWFTAREFLKKYFTHLEFILGNELDWPETSFATGYKNLSWPTLQGYTDSLYFRLREHNLCNHRDYQNLAVNGADSEETIKYIKEISRNKTSLPVIAIYAMMANDLCSGYINSLDDLIKPEKFKKNVLKSLNFLENTLPPNSHVVLVGLVNGSFIYPTMAKHLHPLGQVNKDVTYDDLYNWLNCMKIGPCYQWLNKNETIRTATSKRGEELSNVLKQISVLYKFKSFKLHYMHNPLYQVTHEWQQSGYLIWEMLEPSFGFHPVQKLQPFITKIIWRELVEKNIVGKANPNNEKIQILFGNQGGH